MALAAGEASPTWPDAELGCATRVELGGERAAVGGLSPSLDDGARLVTPLLASPSLVNMRARSIVEKRPSVRSVPSVLRSNELSGPWMRRLMMGAPRHT